MAVVGAVPAVLVGRHEWFTGGHACERASCMPSLPAISRWHRQTRGFKSSRRRLWTCTSAWCNIPAMSSRSATHPKARCLWVLSSHESRISHDLHFPWLWRPSLTLGRITHHHEWVVSQSSLSIYPSHVRNSLSIHPSHMCSSWLQWRTWPWRSGSSHNMPQNPTQGQQSRWTTLQELTPHLAGQPNTRWWA